MDSKLTSDNISDYFFDNQNLPKEEEFSCYLCNATYEKDLQLAAELGKSLLERNKELESSLKNYQNIVEDQSEEIEYLTKQTAALKEVNTSRIKIYEQLEISVQELESSKESLLRQTVADKKQIKSLQNTVESLESRCEELQNVLDSVTNDLENEKKQRNSNSNEASNDSGKKTQIIDDVFSKHNRYECGSYLKVSNQLQGSKTSSAKDQKTIEDLKDRMTLLLQENNYLQEQIETFNKKDEEMRSIQEELATLEQIREGNLCKRCLRSTIPTEDFGSADEMSIGWENDEEREFSKNFIADLSSDNVENHEDNFYRTLVEKYEALLRMQEQQKGIRQRNDSGHISASQSTNLNHLSLRDELQLSGNFYNDKKDMTDSEIEEDHDIVGKEQKENDSEAVTSSSGCADSAIHKGTQTEVLVGSLPGSFLCKISDGNDCQFSIYDDASPVESRFRKTPEYRQLFKEIFAVLKRAAEAKDEGESLPLLDDRLPFLYPQQQLKVPPVTPAREEQLFIPVEDEPEVPATVEQPRELKQNVATAVKFEEKGEESEIERNEDEGDVMKLLAQGVRPKRNLSRGDRRALLVTRRSSPSPSSRQSRSNSKKRTNSKARRKQERLTDSPKRSRERDRQKSNKPVEVHNSLEIFEQMTERRGITVDGRKERPVSLCVFGSGNSSASQGVARLKILEKSYAEVLRMGRQKGGMGKSGCS